MYCKYSTPPLWLLPILHQNKHVYTDCFKLVNPLKKVPFCFFIVTGNTGNSGKQQSMNFIQLHVDVDLF